MKNWPQRHDLPISVNDKLILPFCEGLYFCETSKMKIKTRDQARGRLGQNGRPGGRNFALNGTQGEVGVSLKKKKIFFFFFFLGLLIFILSPHKCKLW